MAKLNSHRGFTAIGLVILFAILVVVSAGGGIGARYLVEQSKITKTGTQPILPPEPETKTADIEVKKSEPAEATEISKPAVLEKPSSKEISHQYNLNEFLPSGAAVYSKPEVDFDGDGVAEVIFAAKKKDSGGNPETYLGVIKFDDRKGDWTLVFRDTAHGFEFSGDTGPVRFEAIEDFNADGNSEVLFIADYAPNPKIDFKFGYWGLVASINGKISVVHRAGFKGSYIAPSEVPDALYRSNPRLSIESGLIKETSTFLSLNAVDPVEVSKVYAFDGKELSPRLSEAEKKEWDALQSNLDQACRDLSAKRFNENAVYFKDGDILNALKLELEDFLAAIDRVEGCQYKLTDATFSRDLNEAVINELITVKITFKDGRAETRNNLLVGARFIKIGSIWKEVWPPGLLGS